MSKFLIPFVKFIKISFISGIVIAIGLSVLFGTAFYYAEGANQQLSFTDSIWWAMVTMTTVGYGDITAQSFVGRFLISYPCMLIGIGIVGILVGKIADYLMDLNSKRRRGLIPVKFNNHIVICNYPCEDKIVALIKELQKSSKYRNSKIVLITKKITELSEKLKEVNLYFIYGDPTSEETLHNANIRYAEGVFVLAHNINDPLSDSRTFTIGSIIEMINPKIRVVTEVISQENIKMMKRAKVDSIIHPNEITNRIMVQEFMQPRIKDVIQQMITN